MDSVRIVAYLSQILIAIFQTLITCDAEGMSPVDLHPSVVYVEEKTDIRVHCTCTPIKYVHSCTFKWERYAFINTDERVKQISSKRRHRIHQVQSEDDTNTLVIERFRRADGGKYVCTTEGGIINISMNRTLYINGTRSKGEKSPLGKVLSCDKQWGCTEKRTNALDQHCNGDVCLGMFNCKNGLTISTERCTRSWCSDKYCIDGGQTLIKSDNVELDQNGQKMDSLKTAVYILIGCTICVLMTAIIVLAVFRIRKRRAAFQISLRLRHRDRQERRDRQSNRHDVCHHCCREHDHCCISPLRNSVVEHEPSISPPSRSYFGNVIVNVNNGVQYLPGRESDYECHDPPSYSEVVGLTSTERRNSPPPAYSTVDRNRGIVHETPEVVENSDTSHPEAAS